MHRLLGSEAYISVTGEAVPIPVVPGAPLLANAVHTR